MKIYVDAGAAGADTLDAKKLFGFKPDVTYAFECNPRFFKDLADREDVNFMPYAVWIEDGTATFSVDESKSAYGSTMMPGKVSHWGRGTKIEVNTIDFSRWIEEHKDNEILVKMDIEGSEFPVLEKMHRDGTDKYIDQLYVEMHPNKVREYTTTYSRNLLAKLNCGMVKEWH